MRGFGQNRVDARTVSKRPVETEVGVKVRMDDRRSRIEAR